MIGSDTSSRKRSSSGESSQSKHHKSDISSSSDNAASEDIDIETVEKNELEFMMKIADVPIEQTSSK